MFRQCLLLLAISVDVLSFVPSITNSKRLDILHELNRQQKDRATQLVVGSRINNNDDDGDNNNDGHSVTCLATGFGTTVLAAILVLGPLLVAPDPTEARMTPDYSLSPTKIAEPKPMRPVRTSVAPNSLSDSFLLLSEDFNLNELRIQPKYLDLAGDLKEELKFRAQQGKEKALEKAREAQEKQQAATEARDARNKVYDDMFDQAEKERNEYYSQRIISRDTYLQNLRDQEANQDRSEYNRAMGAFNPEGSPADELKYKLENNLQDEKNIRTALAENKQKDRDDRDTKVERTLLKKNSKRRKRRPQNSARTLRSRKASIPSGCSDRQRSGSTRIVPWCAKRERRRPSKIFARSNNERLRPMKNCGPERGRKPKN